MSMSMTMTVVKCLYPDRSRGVRSLALCCDRDSLTLRITGDYYGCRPMQETEKAAGMKEKRKTYLSGWLNIGQQQQCPPFPRLRILPLTLGFFLYRTNAICKMNNRPCLQGSDADMEALDNEGKTIFCDSACEDTGTDIFGGTWCNHFGLEGCRACDVYKCVSPNKPFYEVEDSI